MHLYQMVRVVSANNSCKYYTRSSISLVQTLNISLGFARNMSNKAPTDQMPGQHENLSSDFPTSTADEGPPAVADSPFLPDFDAAPPTRTGENPPTPSPTAPRTDSPEFPNPPSTSPPSHEAPRPPTSPPGQPEAFPPRAPDAKPPSKPKDPREQTN